MLVGNRVDPRQAGRKLQIFAARFHQQSPVPAQPSHQKAQLKQDVLPRRIVDFRNRDGNVGLVERAFKSLDRVVRGAEGAFRPNRDVERLVFERSLDRSCDFAAFFGRQDENANLLTDRRYEGVALLKPAGKFVRKNAQDLRMPGA